MRSCLAAISIIRGHRGTRTKLRDANAARARMSHSFRSPRTAAGARPLFTPISSEPCRAEIARGLCPETRSRRFQTHIWRDSRPGAVLLGPSTFGEVQLYKWLVRSQIRPNALCHLAKLQQRQALSSCVFSFHARET